MFGRRAVDLPGTVPSLGAAGSGDRPGALDVVATLAPGMLPGKPAPAARFSGAPDRRGETLKVTLSRIQATLYERIDASAATKLPRDELNRQILELIGEIVVEQRMSLTTREQEALSATIIDDMVGLGPLEPLLCDEGITDIMVNGARQVYVERRGKLELTDVQFRDNQHVMNVAQRIVTRIGRRVDETCPVCDARLEDGSRVNVIAPPLAIDGCAISIRKFAKKSITLDVMARQSNLSEALARVLKVASACRLNIVISGGTGSGKTTMLNAMSQLIDTGERVVTIEDAAELQLHQDHVLRLESRPANIEGKGAVEIRDLVKNSLRMRPDRIIVGEVRDSSALDMLQAMNTGHDGSICTIHSNGPRDTLARIETMVLMAGMDLPMRAIREQVASAVDLIVHQARLRDGSRRITHVTEVERMEGDVITLQDIFLFDHSRGFDESGRSLGALRSTGLRPKFLEKLAQNNVHVDPMLFAMDGGF
jgi:pilus assembly protein CpaF